MRDANIPFHYHNGFFQRANVATSTVQIDEPFWDLMRDPKWKNVDMDMKKAIDLRDNAGRHAVFYAAKALESVVKIISDEKKWTTDNEKGAAMFVDNLVNKNNGRFIEAWESVALKAIFKVRNDHGHGPGSSPQPSLTTQQQTWVIESSMSWIKSLILRM